MSPSPKEFRDSCLERLLALLWRQWSLLGIAGYGGAAGDWLVDPEALLIFTCGIARHDARLFDEVLDWLDVNGSSINIQRLRGMIRRERFTGTRVLAAVAETVSRRHGVLKWKGLFEGAGAPRGTESLFFARDGGPMEQFGKADPTFRKHGLLRGGVGRRGHAQRARMEDGTTLLLKLRALFGISARAEIIAYLVAHGGAHPSLIARETYYSQKTVQDALVEMSRSGLVRVRRVGREKHYRLEAGRWLPFLSLEGERPRWINWPLLFSALERIWLKLNEEGFSGLRPLVLSSELRALMRSVGPKIEAAGLAAALSDDKPHLGESYTPVFHADIERVFLAI